MPLFQTRPRHGAEQGPVWRLKERHDCAGGNRADIDLHNIYGSRTDQSSRRRCLKSPCPFPHLDTKIDRLILCNPATKPARLISNDHTREGNTAQNIVVSLECHLVIGYESWYVDLQQVVLGTSEKVPCEVQRSGGASGGIIGDFRMGLDGAVR